MKNEVYKVYLGLNNGTEPTFLREFRSRRSAEIFIAENETTYKNGRLILRVEAL